MVSFMLDNVKPKLAFETILPNDYWKNTHNCQRRDKEDQIEKNEGQKHQIWRKHIEKSQRDDRHYENYGNEYPAFFWIREAMGSTSYDLH